MPGPIEKIRSLVTQLSDPLRIFFLVLITIVGLLLSSNFIFYKDRYGVSRFHEISWRPKEVVGYLADHALIDTINMADTAKPVTEQKQKQINALKKLKGWLNTKPDTAVRAALNKNSALFIDTRDLDISTFSYDIKNKNDYVELYPPIKVTYTDTSLINGKISDSVPLKIKYYNHVDQFFNKYPGFGLWSLLILIQTVFYFLLIAGIFFHFMSASANEQFKNLGYNRLTEIVSMAGMLIFSFAVFWIILHKNGALQGPQIIFMRSLANAFGLVNFAGYLAAAFCLAGLVICVIYMNQLKQKNLPDATEILNLRNEIKRRFNTYFVFAAIILSLAIFTNGTYFSSMNSMDFIKQVSRDQGFSPVNPDMVYLYGILNSFFLILAYLPARYLLTSLDKSFGPVDATTTTGNIDDAKGKAFGQLSKMLSGMTEVLVATSPFLASLLQNLLDIIFK